MFYVIIKIGDNMKNRKLIKILFLSVYTLFIFLQNISLIHADSDVYDVILFWGQSNMRGASGTGTCQGKVDENLGKTDASRYHNTGNIR